MASFSHFLFLFVTIATSVNPNRVSIFEDLASLLNPNSLYSVSNTILGDGELCSGTGQNSKSTGLCMKSGSCSLHNGSEIGRCSNSFRVCCIIPVTGSATSAKLTTVTKQAVLLRQNGLENSVSVFEFPKQPGICQVTLKFLDTQLANPALDIINAGNCDKDSVTVIGSPTLMSGSISVCGDLSDQHMHLSYDDSGLAEESSDKITVTIKTTSSAAKYSINAYQVKCDAPDRVSAYCLQQFVGATGTIKSFGFPYQLNSQYYHICTRGEDPGVQSVTWAECSTTGVGGRNAKPFFITGSIDENGNYPPPEYGDVVCSSDYLDNTFLGGRHCGGSFPKITVPRPLGHMTVSFDGNEVRYTAVVMGLPPSVASCANIAFPGHTCAHPLHPPQRDTSCICTLNSLSPIQLQMPLGTDEICPSVKGYSCSKTRVGQCSCLQEYDEADQGNTGFCLQYTHNY